eukprot:COSAG06_NODE_3_length_43832_cov_136.908399_22_plen_212_part_00
MLLRRSILATLTLAAALVPAVDAIPDVERAIAAAGTQIASSAEVFPLSGRRQLESCELWWPAITKTANHCRDQCNLARSYADCIHRVACTGLHPQGCRNPLLSLAQLGSCEEKCEYAATEVGWPAENRPWPHPDIAECSCDLQCSTRYSGCDEFEEETRRHHREEKNLIAGMLILVIFIAVCACACLLKCLCSRGSDTKVAYRGPLLIESN